MAVPATLPEQDLGLLPLVPGGEEGKPPFLRRDLFHLNFKAELQITVRVAYCLQQRISNPILL